VNGVPVTTARPRRVYTIRTAWLLLSLALLTPAAGAQTPGEITIDPVMVKGAPGAPVTIVEFSDYQ
jgi:hypothetical protein